MSKIAMLVVVLASLVAPARAAKFTKRVNHKRLGAELAAAGCQVDSIATKADDSGEVVVHGCKDAAAAAVVKAHVYEPPSQERAVELAKKLKAGTITADEKDEIIKLTLLKFWGLE
jgi:hypothetical protein